MTRKRYLRFIYLALTLITQLTPAAMAQSAWYRLTGADRDFAIEFPSRPTYEEVSVPSARGRLQTYHFAYGNNLLSFNYIDLRLPSETSKASAVVLLEDYARDYTKAIIDAGGQVLMRTPLPDGGTEFISKHPAGKSRETGFEQSRVYFWGARRYVLSCTSLSVSGIDQSVARRFFSSFRWHGTRDPVGADSQHGTQEPVGVDTGGKKATQRDTARHPDHVTWYRFKSFDGDFEAEFPDKPHYDTKAHPVTGAQMQSVSFHYGEYDLSIQSSEIVPPFTTPAERERWFAGAAERFVRGSESSLIRQTRLADGALQIDSRREISGRALHIRVRLYARELQAYVVTCSVFSQNPSALDEPLPERFFASFRLR